MIRGRRLACAAALIACLASPASADSDQDFTLINNTGHGIQRLYAALAGSNAWGDNLLGQEAIDDGDSFPVEFPAGTHGCAWDLKADFSNRTSAIWRNLSICDMSRITLFVDSSGQTRAIAEPTEQDGRSIGGADMD